MTLNKNNDNLFIYSDTMYLIKQLIIKNELVLDSKYLEISFDSYDKALDYIKDREGYYSIEKIYN